MEIKVGASHIHALILLCRRILTKKNSMAHCMRKEK